jgi:hypothetical protein
MRVRVPFDGGGKRLHFQGVPEAVNGEERLSSLPSAAMTPPTSQTSNL